MKKGLTDLQLVNNIHQIAKSMAALYDETPASKEMIQEMILKLEGHFYYTFEEDSVLFNKKEFEYAKVQFEAFAIDGRWYVNIIKK